MKPNQYRKAIEAALSEYEFPNFNDALYEQLIDDIVYEIEQEESNPSRFESRIDIIKTRVCEYYSVPQCNLTSRSRKRETHSTPRQLVFWFAKKYTRLPLVKIGLSCNRDHATAMYGIKAVNNLIETNPHIKETVDYLDVKIFGEIRRYENNKDQKEQAGFAKQKIEHDEGMTLFS